MTLSGGQRAVLWFFPALRKELERLHQQVDHAAAIFHECSVTSGICCCGDNMENHENPMFCGHSPTDSGGWSVYQWLEAYQK